VGRDSEAKIRTRNGLDPDGQRTIRLAPGRCHDPLGNLFLDGQHDSRGDGPQRKKGEQKGRRDIVRHVRDHLQRSIRRNVFEQIDVQRVGVDHDDILTRVPAFP